MLPTQKLHLGQETIFVKTSVDPVILVISNQLSRFLKTFRPAPLVTVLLCSRTMGPRSPEDRQTLWAAVTLHGHGLDAACRQLPAWKKK